MFKNKFYISTQSDKPIRFKPPLTDVPSALLEALKANIEMELKSIKLCTYKTYKCSQVALDGFNYCLRHILEDKDSPYKQCAYVYSSNGKRCPLATIKDKDSMGYCDEHALKGQQQNLRRGIRYQPPRTGEVLLHSISHYLRKPKSTTLSDIQHPESHTSTSNEDDGLLTKSLDPFVDVDANAVLAAGSDILDMYSESESDVDTTTYGSVWHDAHGESSEDESIDSEQEDVLKHANIYTAEEVTLITRDKLIRLQSLYINHFRYLTHMLRERKRRYLYGLKREKETYCSIYNQLHDTPKEQRLYKKLKAYNSYHKKHGIEAICHKKLHERRLKATEGSNFKPPSYTRCIFTEGGVKCGERALPVTRHCRKHILEDPNQVLFRACGKMSGDIECTTPVEAISDDTTCRLHLDIPQVRSYSNIRKDSESDYEESVDHHITSISSAKTFTLDTKNIKLETNIDESSNEGTSNIKIEAEYENIKTEPFILISDNSDMDVITDFMREDPDLSDNAEVGDYMTLPGVIDVPEIINNTDKVVINNM